MEVSAFEKKDERASLFRRLLDGFVDIPFDGEILLVEKLFDAIHPIRVTHVTGLAV
jgi:hypothetical protein